MLLGCNQAQKLLRVSIKQKARKGIRLPLVIWSYNIFCLKLPGEHMTGELPVYAAYSLLSYRHFFFFFHQPFFSSVVSTIFSFQQIPCFPLFFLVGIHWSICLSNRLFLTSLKQLLFVLFNIKSFTPFISLILSVVNRYMTVKPQHLSQYEFLRIGL